MPGNIVNFPRIAGAPGAGPQEFASPPPRKVAPGASSSSKGYPSWDVHSMPTDGGGATEAAAGIGAGAYADTVAQAAAAQGGGMQAAAAQAEAATPQPTAPVATPTAPSPAGMVVRYYVAKIPWWAWLAMGVGGTLYVSTYGVPGWKYVKKLGG